jgi:hypothetical protein
MAPDVVAGVVDVMWSVLGLEMPPRCLQRQR